MPGIIKRMYNWSVDTARLKKDKVKYDIWKLEQQINYGMGKGKKIDKILLKKYLHLLQIDPKKKAYLEFIL